MKVNTSTFNHVFLKPHTSPSISKWCSSCLHALSTSGIISHHRGWVFIQDKIFTQYLVPYVPWVLKQVHNILIKNTAPYIFSDFWLFMATNSTVHNNCFKSTWNNCVPRVYLCLPIVSVTKCFEFSQCAHYLARNDFIVSSYFLQSKAIKTHWRR